MNPFQRWIEVALGYPVDWDATAGWAQFAGAMIALLVTLQISLRQFISERRKDRQRIGAFMGSAVAAVEHAEIAFSEVDTRLGRMKHVDRDQVAMSPALHMLEAVETMIVALPLHDAPSEKVARGLLGVLSQVRQVSGNLRQFLADPSNAGMRMTYESNISEVAHAAIDLRAEQHRLKGRAGE